MRDIRDGECAKCGGNLTADHECGSFVAELEYEYNRKTNALIERHAKQITALQTELAQVREELERTKLGWFWPRTIFHDSDEGGRAVRHAWVKWAKQQPNPKDSWLVPYDELSEPDKEADRQIAQYLAETLLRDLQSQLAAAESRVKELEAALREIEREADDPMLSCVYCSKIHTIATKALEK